MQNWDGNASDNKIFQERASALIDSFKASETLKFCVADSKLYHSGNAQFLSQINFITLIPSTIKLEKESIQSALLKKEWTEIDENYKYTPLTVEHMKMKQRWLVVRSTAAKERAQKAIKGLVDKELKAIDKAFIYKLNHLLAKQMPSKL